MGIGPLELGRGAMVQGLLDGRDLGKAWKTPED